MPQTQVIPMDKPQFTPERRAVAITALRGFGFLGLGFGLGLYAMSSVVVAHVEPGFAAANPGVEAWYHCLLGVALVLFVAGLVGAFALEFFADDR
jgi:hypothetical protein